MSYPSRIPAVRSRRLGVSGAIAAAVMFSAGIAPASTAAQEGTEGSAGSVGSAEGGSLDEAIGQIPEEIVVGPGIGGGSEGLERMGSAAVPEAAQSVGEVAGSMAPLEALGSTGGSAAGSVASSGSLPGSTYVNPTGSVGSGTIGLGSLAVPEIALPILSLNFAAGYFEALGERQEAAELYPHELTFWHGVVTESARGGAFLEEATETVGAELPAPLVGSIENVRDAADSDPFEEQEQRRAELEAEASADEADDDAATEDPEEPGESAGAAERGESSDGDVDESAAAQAEVTTAGADVATADADPAGALAQAAPVGADSATTGTATAAPKLAETGVGATALIGVALTSLIVGTLLVGTSRRRA